MTTGRLRPQAPIAKADTAKVLDAVLGARVHVDVTVPRTDVRARMRLVSRTESLTILAEAREAFSSKGLPTDIDKLAAMGALNEWNLEIAMRHLAFAVRDSADTALPLAALEEWAECDEDQISALWTEYQDLRERLDPARNFAELTEAEVKAMASYAKKKPRELDLLMSFGSRKLALFVTTSVEPPAS